MAFLQTHAFPPVYAIVLFQKPSSVDIPLKKATETDLYIPIEVIVPPSSPLLRWNIHRRREQEKGIQKSADSYD